MPIFDLYCKKCGSNRNDEFVHSDSFLPECCGDAMTKKPSRMLPGFPKQGLTLTNVEEKPVHFDSKRQLREYKNKHNLELGALPND